MNRFSRNCCGGPVLALSLAFLLFGMLFVSLSAISLGVVFMGVGILAEGLCLLMGRSRCKSSFAQGRAAG